MLAQLQWIWRSIDTIGRSLDLVFLGFLGEGAVELVKQAVSCLPECY